MARQTDLTAPPRLAQGLLRWVSGGVSVPLLGDLAEEFAHMHADAPHAARRWYWRQALGSLAPLLSHRLRQAGIKRIALIGISTLMAFLIIRFWDIYIARNSARLMASGDNAPALIIVRTAYFAVQMFGVALAGALIAQLTFNRTRSFRDNALSTLGPIIVVLCLAALMTIILTKGQYPLGYLALKLGLTLPALLFGAWAGMRSGS